MAHVQWQSSSVSQDEGGPGQHGPANGPATVAGPESSGEAGAAPRQDVAPQSADVAVKQEQQRALAIQDMIRQFDDSQPESPSHLAEPVPCVVDDDGGQLRQIAQTQRLAMKFRFFQETWKVDD